MTSFKKGLFVILFGFSFSALAWQPSKPIEVTVPFPAGSGNDLVIRPLAAAVEKNTGAKFLITNRPGAGGTVGTASLASKPNDGHHIGILSIGGTAAMDYVVMAQLPKQPYTVNSFAYATALAQSPMVVIANKNDPVSTPERFINVLTYDKSVSFANSGGSGGLAAETILFYTDALNKNPSIAKVEHKGPVETMSDVIGGHVRFGVVPLAVAYSNYKAGNFKIIGVTQQAKSKETELNTFANVNKNIDVGLVWGIALPKDTPADVLNWYATVFKEAQNDPAVKEGFEKNRYSPVDSLQTPETFATYVMGQSKQHSKIVESIIKNQKAGIK
jgi:tripartite-type tricarboxylate transporter receptor subunit TctC